MSSRENDDTTQLRNFTTRITRMAFGVIPPPRIGHQYNKSSLHLSSLPPLWRGLTIIFFHLPPPTYHLRDVINHVTSAGPLISSLTHTTAFDLWPPPGHRDDLDPWPPHRPWTATCRQSWSVWSCRWPSWPTEVAASLAWRCCSWDARSTRISSLPRGRRLTGGCWVCRGEGGVRR